MCISDSMLIYMCLSPSLSPQVRDKREVSKAGLHGIVLCENHFHLISLIVPLIKDVNIQLIWNTQGTSQLSEIM